MRKILYVITLCATLLGLSACNGRLDGTEWICSSSKELDPGLSFRIAFTNDKATLYKEEDGELTDSISGTYALNGESIEIKLGGGGINLSLDGKIVSSDTMILTTYDHGNSMQLTFIKR